MIVFRLDDYLATILNGNVSTPVRQTSIGFLVLALALVLDELKAGKKENENVLP